MRLDLKYMEETTFQLYVQIFCSCLLLSFQYIQLTTLDGISQLVLPVLQEDSRPSSQFTINQGNRCMDFSDVYKWQNF